MTLRPGAEAVVGRTIGGIDVFSFPAPGGRRPRATTGSPGVHGDRAEVHGDFLIGLVGAAASRLITDLSVTDLLLSALDVRLSGKVHLGETVCAHVRVVEVEPSGAAQLEAWCEREDGAMVAEGTLRLAPLQARTSH